MARPNRIYEEKLINQICDLIEVGNYIPTACAAVGISEGTYYRWLAQGKEVALIIDDLEDADDLRERMMDGEIPEGFTMLQVRSYEFRERVLMASGRAEAYAVGMVRNHMPSQWTAAMTFLERRFPGRWKRKEQIDIGDADAGSSGIDETLLLGDPTAMRLIHDALERVAKGELMPGPTPVDATVVEDDDDDVGT